ncbi:MAG: hypothetical protein ABIP48_11925 [Planctomycetota bacterium]
MSDNLLVEIFPSAAPFPLVLSQPPMAIHFYCRRCRQLLGIATRKAGTEIQCPKCAFPQTVPSKKEATATVAMTRVAAAVQRSHQTPDSVVYDDEAAVMGTPGHHGSNQTEPLSPFASGAPLSPFASGAPVPRAAYEAGRPMPPGTILYRRRTLYVHAVLFLLLGGGAFVAGYFVGRGDAALEPPVAHRRLPKESVLVDGKIYYDTGTGSVAPDAGAVLIALPAGRLPEATLSIEDLRPVDPAPTPTSQSVRRIEDLGGIHTRADAAGAFAVVLPVEGSYHVLIISRQTTRQEDTAIDELDLSQMQSYFYRAADLVGPYKYRWTLEQITPATPTIDHNFGRSGR